MNMDQDLVVHSVGYREGAEESAGPEASALEKWCFPGESDQRRRDSIPW